MSTSNLLSIYFSQLEQPSRSEIENGYFQSILNTGNEETLVDYVTRVNQIRFGSVPDTATLVEWSKDPVFQQKVRERNVHVQQLIHSNAVQGQSSFVWSLRNQL